MKLFVNVTMASLIVLLFFIGCGDSGGNNPVVQDVDNDGYTVEQGDCDDSDPTCYPGAEEVCGDGIDQNCDTVDIDCNEDSDGDGLTNTDEKNGWTVYVVKSNGQSEERDVTSDPMDNDTDDDGVNDGDEKRLNMDSRSADTDADRVSDYDEAYTYRSSPIMQDTDGDGLDDYDEVVTYGSNPDEADTDGDGYEDGEELSLNHHPRIADVPRPRIRVESIDVALQGTFEWTDELGESQTEGINERASLSQSSSDKYATSDESTNTTTIGTSAEIESQISAEIGDESKLGASVTAKAGLTSGYEMGHTANFSKESCEEASEAYEKSLNSSATLEERHTQKRTIDSATMKVAVMVENTGKTSFAIDGIELSALNQDQQDLTQFKPIASVTSTTLSDPIDLGPVGTSLSSKGPFIFEANNFSPTEAQELLKYSRGLVVKMANFHVEDESGRNLGKTWEYVMGRTAGITLDYGDGNIDKYRVATNSSFKGEDAEAQGISMQHALERILGLKKGKPDGYDTAEVKRKVGLETKDVHILTRIKDVEAVVEDDPATPRIDETRAFWVVSSTKDIDRSINFGDIQLDAGDYVSLAFVQDQDGDGVFAREEYLHRSSDQNVNTDGCSDDDPATPEYEGTCDINTVDLLTDFEEIREGWEVTVGNRSYKTHSSPALPDSDGDEIMDHDERICGLDARLKDTDGDGISDYDELYGYDIYDPNDEEVLIRSVPVFVKPAILDGGDGVVSTDLAEDDVWATGADDGAVDAGAVVILPGPNGNIDSDPTLLGGDDYLVAEEEGHFAGPADCYGGAYATDPLDPDTDTDGIWDGAELENGNDPNNKADGADQRDTDEDGLTDFQEENGWIIIVNGEEITVTSDSSEPDTDFDGLPDLLEWHLGSNPADPDTDEDEQEQDYQGLGDYEEYAGSETCVGTTATDGPEACSNFQQKHIKFKYQCNKDTATRCWIPEELEEYSDTNHTGTNLNLADTDKDGIDDYDEVYTSYNITVFELGLSGGGSDKTITDIKTHPRDPDMDDDGMKDGVEKSKGFHADNTDTDNDGTLDKHEHHPSGYPKIWAGSKYRQANVADARVKVDVDKYHVGSNAGCEAGFLCVDVCYNEADLRYRIKVTKPGESNPVYIDYSGWYTNHSACRFDDYVAVKSNNAHTCSKSDAQSFIIKRSSSDKFILNGIAQETVEIVAWCPGGICGSYTWDIMKEYTGNDLPNGQVILMPKGGNVSGGIEAGTAEDNLIDDSITYFITID